jgi:hypothetical protein
MGSYIKKNQLKLFFISILSFYFVFHYVFPYVVHTFVFETTTTHQAIIGLNDLDLKKILLINLGCVLVAILGISYLPFKSRVFDFRIESKNVILLLVFLYIIALLRTIFPYYREIIGIFDPILQFVSYKTITTLLILFAEGALPIVTFIYTLIFCIFKGSRAIALYSLVVLLLYIPFNTDGYKKLKALLIITFVASIISPWQFFFSTQLKMLSAQFEGSDEVLVKEKNVVNNEVLLNIVKKSKHPQWNLIVGRISLFERGGIPIYYKDNIQKNDFKEKINFFKMKHNLLRQFKMFLNSFTIGNFFEHDHFPNQYNKYIFWNYDLKKVGNIYHSINMSFPSYIYLYFGLWGTLILFPIIVICIYVIAVFASNYSPMICYSLATTLYSFLLFFDWTSFLVTLLFTNTCLFFAGVPFFVKGNSRYDFYSCLKDFCYKLKLVRP